MKLVRWSSWLDKRLSSTDQAHIKHTLSWLVKCLMRACVEPALSCKRDINYSFIHQCVARWRPTCDQQIVGSNFGHIAAILGASSLSAQDPKMEIITTPQRYEKAMLIG